MKLSNFLASQTININVVGCKQTLSIILTLFYNKEQRALTIMEDLEGLEKVIKGLRQQFNITDDLEIALALVFNINKDSVTPDEAADKVTVAVSVELNDSLATTKNRDLEQNLASNIDHECTLIAVCNQSIINMSECVGLIGCSWQFFTPNRLLDLVVKKCE